MSNLKSKLLSFLTIAGLLATSVAPLAQAEIQLIMPLLPTISKPTTAIGAALPFNPKKDPLQFNYNISNLIGTANIGYSIINTANNTTIFPFPELTAKSNGNHSVSWNGYDKSNPPKIVANGNYKLRITAYLTNNSVITKDSDLFEVKVPILGLPAGDQSANPAGPIITNLKVNETPFQIGLSQKSPLDISYDYANLQNAHINVRIFSPSNPQFTIKSSGINLLTTSGSGTSHFMWDGRYTTTPPTATGLCAKDIEEQKQQINPSANEKPLVKSGTYTVEITGTDGGSKTALTPQKLNFVVQNVLLQAAPFDPSITVTKADPSPFNPKLNAGDVISFQYNSNVCGEVSAIVLTSNNVPLPIKLVSTIDQAGNHAITWNGKDTNNLAFADGNYKVTLRITYGQGLTLSSPPFNFVLNSASSVNPPPSPIIDAVENGQAQQPNPGNDQSGPIQEAPNNLPVQGGSMECLKDIFLDASELSSTFDCQAVQFLVQNNIFSGKNSNGEAKNFYPNGGLSRAEGAKIIALSSQLLNLPEKFAADVNYLPKKILFADLKADFWGSNFIYFLKKGKFYAFQGSGTNKFAPNKNLTVAEFLSTVLRFKLTVPTDFKGSFTNVKKGQDYYKTSVATKYLQLWEGETLPLKKPITRIEAARVLYKLAQIK